METQLTLADYVVKIDKADVYSAAIKTELTEATKLSKQTNHRILLKREDQQPVFSFKVRGAANKIFQMPASEIENGVVCSSAGNHAQGVALAAAKRGVPAHIVMPAEAQEIKVSAVEELGGKVVLAGDDYDATQEFAYDLAKREGLAFVHPFNDPDVIAGQGTVAKEIVDELDELGAIFIPIGGGGLAAGVSTYIKAKFPNAKIVGVEPANAASMLAAFKAGGPVKLDTVGTFADGVAVREVGDESYRLCAMNLDEIVTVSTDEICAAMQIIFEDTRTLVEPAGALAVAAIMKTLKADSPLPEPAVAIVCGANMNFDRLRHVAERAAIGADTEALFAVTIPEEKGSFLKFAEDLGSYNITEFNYRMSKNGVARIFVGIGLNGKVSRSDVAKLLNDKGYDNTDLTDSETAKLHIRHLAAGSGSAENEQIFRFRFPEKTGALHHFLQSIGNDWNISLFHYRNHGSDYGRVLAGIQVPEGTETSLHMHLGRLGFPYSNETNDIAYKLFLT